MSIWGNVINMNYTKKITTMTSLAIATMVTVSQAATLNVMVNPRGSAHDGGNVGGSPDPLYGTLSDLTSSQYGISNATGVLVDSGLVTSIGVAVYNITFSNHPEFGDISFDLTVSASAAGETAGLLYNGGGNYFWSVDTGDDFTFGSASDEAGDQSRIRGGEFVSFEVSNLYSSGNNVSFGGFTGICVSQNGSFDAGSGLFTGADGADGKGGRITNCSSIWRSQPSQNHPVQLC
jgi:hypothetical protein